MGQKCVKFRLLLENLTKNWSFQNFNEICEKFGSQIKNCEILGKKLTPRRQNVVRNSLILAGKTLRFDELFIFFLQFFPFFAREQIIY